MTTNFSHPLNKVVHGKNQVPGRNILIYHKGKIVLFILENKGLPCVTVMKTNVMSRVQRIVWNEHFLTIHFDAVVPLFS